MACALAIATLSELLDAIAKRSTGVVFAATLLAGNEYRSFFYGDRFGCLGLSRSVSKEVDALCLPNTREIE